MGPKYATVNYFDRGVHARPFFAFDRFFKTLFGASNYVELMIHSLRCDERASIIVNTISRCLTDGI